MPRNKPVTSVGDTVFAGVARTAALAIMLALAGVFVFLFIEGFPGLSAPTDVYRPAEDFLSYVGPLVFGTIWAALVALIIAVPFAIGIALFISHYAPARLAVPIAYVIDLLAAVPSVVYGLWGGLALAQALKPVLVWLDTHLGFIPLFVGPASVTGRTMLTAAIVLAIMIVPIVTAISREIFAQTPRLHEEAAMALGATRWEMIRLAVFPYARSGVISAVMLGLGRALGETMAVAMVLSATQVVTLNLISDTNPATIASNIASNYKEASPDRQAVLIATGLVLFAVTFAVNFAARMVIARGERKIAR
ncbi:phosphate ABC transporter permease [Nocardioides sp. Root1257]|uniref:phosphate ABC transporter permease subunit PstC n=1 Tax=unclassified Nocardioides TaxID=2615069 RepID=UPI0006FA95E4|nr:MULTISPECIES: phosphate ABC transporter permease subunit PstC [unclassified Nocardioides]KQW48515.1 phosphate ABC transporter permease [Nocardioides sp. Root1257]KRC47691.1 phosphate ABC transporter permease [Nocardioides sp. Root224]